MSRQELHCTNCLGRIVFDMDFNQDGNHRITCPDCGHIHYRVVVSGVITEERWNRRYNTYTVTNITFYASSSAGGTSTYGTTNWFFRDSWYNTSTSGTGGT